MKNIFADFRICGPFLNYLKNLLKSNDSTLSKQKKLENNGFLNMFENKNNLMFIKYPLFAQFSNELMKLYELSKKKVKKDLPFTIIISASQFVLSILIKHQLNLDENNVNINLQNQNVKFTYLASKVEEYIIKKKKNKLEFSNEFQHGFFVLNLQIGTLYFELIRGEDSTLYFICTKKVVDHIEEYLSMDYINLPMIHPPRFWTDFKNGGFLSKTNLIHINRAISNHKLELDNNNLLNAVNKMSNIKFEVNTELLQFIINNPEYIKMYKKSTKATSNIIKLTIQLFQVFSILSFYLPIYCDWRGRLYVNSSFINYQGSNQSKALIQFSEGEVLDSNGLKYLYYFGANCYGNDKMLFKEKILWVNENYNSIINLDFNFISKAEDIFGFLSFAQALRKYKNDPLSKIKIIVYQDATCSGLQHISALLHDEILGSQVNVIVNNNNNNK